MQRSRIVEIARRIREQLPKGSLLEIVNHLSGEVVENCGSSCGESWVPYISIVPVKASQILFEIRLSNESTLVDREATLARTFACLCLHTDFLKNKCCFLGGRYDIDARKRFDFTVEANEARTFADAFLEGLPSQMSQLDQVRYALITVRGLQCERSIKDARRNCNDLLLTKPETKLCGTCEARDMASDALEVLENMESVINIQRCDKPVMYGYDSVLRRAFTNNCDGTYYPVYAECGCLSAYKCSVCGRWKLLEDAKLEILT